MVTKKYVDQMVGGVTVDNIGQIVDSAATLTVSPGGALAVSSSSYININGQTHTVSIGATGLTSEEIRELDSLNLEKKELIRLEKLSKFRKFPQHIRQKIVDEIQMSNLITDLVNTKLSIENSVEKRIVELEQKDNRIRISANGLDGFYFNHTSSIDELTNHISEEEILDIHSSISLEEALSTSTDSIKKYE